MRSAACILFSILCWTAAASDSARAEPAKRKPPSDASPGRAPSPSFEQRRKRALAAKKPGTGNPDAESKATFNALSVKYAAKPGTGGQRAPAQPGRKPTADVVDACTGKPFEIKAIQTSPPLDPGDRVEVSGCGFRDNPGELRLAGDFAGGHLKLKVQSWKNHSIVASMPLVTGVKDMPGAKLQVVRHDGKFSNYADAGGFRATREVKYLSIGDVTVSCGHPSASDDAECGALMGRTVGAVHDVTVPSRDCDPEDLMSSSYEVARSDRISVSLANGWVLAGYNWWWWLDVGGGYVLPPAGFVSEASSATVVMEWGLWVSACRNPQNRVRYRLELYAVGPKGVPHELQ